MVEDARSGQYDADNAPDRIRRGLRGTLSGFDGQLRKHALDRRLRVILIIGFLCIVMYGILKLG